MVDRISGSPNRWQIIPESGTPFYAILEMADNPIEVGTKLNKAFFLTDATAALYSLTGTDATVNNALFSIKTSLNEHVGSTGASHGLATASVAGFMSATQFSTLSTANTNLTAHIGSTGSSHGLASASVAGFMSSTQFTTLNTLNTNLNAHIGATGSAHGAATSSANGFMTSAQVSSLSTLSTTINNHIGTTGSSHGLATSSVAGFMSSTQYTLLDTINTRTSGIIYVGSSYGPTLIGSGSSRYSTSNTTNCIVTAGTSSGTPSGSYNSAFGYNALPNTTSAAGCSAFGGYALNACTTGYNNTAIGYQCLSDLTTYYNCTGIGYNAQVTGIQQVQLGGSGTTVYAWSALQVRSDERDKTDIRDTVLGMDFINRLRPIDYKWDVRDDYIETIVNEDGSLSKISHPKDGSKTRTRYHHGFIAQDVAKIIEETGNDFGGYQDHKINGGKDVLSLGYTEFIGPIIKGIQELDTKLSGMERAVYG